MDPTVPGTGLAVVQENTETARSAELAPILAQLEAIVERKLDAHGHDLGASDD